MDAPTLDTLTVDDFSARLGDGWSLGTADGPLGVVRLIEASVTGERPFQPGGRKPFRLVFGGPSSLVLPQGIYTLARDGFGELEVFVVPLQPGRDSLFEAVFS